jgi:hypothetical protein
LRRLECMTAEELAIQRVRGKRWRQIFEGGKKRAAEEVRVESYCGGRLR